MIRTTDHFAAKWLTRSFTRTAALAIGVATAAAAALTAGCGGGSMSNMGAGGGGQHVVSSPSPTPSATPTPGPTPTPAVTPPPIPTPTATEATSCSTYTPAPMVSSISPTSGHIGDTISIYGKGFETCTAGDVILVNFMDASGEWTQTVGSLVNDGQVNVRVPNPDYLTNATVDVVVIISATDGNTAATPINPADRFTYIL